MPHFSACLLVSAALVLAASPTRAATLVYTDKASFLAATSATAASGPLPAGGPYTSLTLGTITYQSATGQAFSIADYSARLVGNELSIDGLESINIVTAAPVYSLGFDFVEPNLDPNVNAAFIDSTFTVTLLNGTTFVDSYSFNAPNDTTAFEGVSSTIPFNSVQIRETTGSSENEFFGQIYTSVAPAPEPGTWATIGTGMAGMAAAACCRRRRAI